MFRKIAIMTATIALAANLAQAQSKDKQAVAKAVEQLTKAMTDGDRASLKASTLPQLSYGHSGGHVEGQDEFVEKIASGKSDFVQIDISNQNISVLGNTAIVRHHLHATTNDGNKPGEVSLDILLVFHKDKKAWKLLARQAVKAK